MENGSDGLELTIFHRSFSISHLSLGKAQIDPAEWIQSTIAKARTGKEPKPRIFTGTAKNLKL